MCQILSWSKSHIIPWAAEEPTTFMLTRDRLQLSSTADKMATSPKNEAMLSEKSKEISVPALPIRITNPKSTTTSSAVISFKPFICQTVNNNMQGINSQLKHVPYILLCTQSKVICIFTCNTHQTKQKGHSLCLRKFLALFSSIIKA